MLDFLTGPLKALLGTIGTIIDDLSTTDEEKLAAKLKLAELQNDFERDAMKYDAQIKAEQASVLRAEAQSESWLTRTWRPITMLAFVVLIFMRWFGFTPDTLPDAEVIKVFDIVQIGVGGYIVSRGVEKGIKTWKSE